MRLLFDQNLSPKLPRRLAESFPGSLHVREVGLERAPDEEIWRFAAREGLCIVSKDTDFRQRSFLFGAPPKVISIGRGNCTTQEIADLLTAGADTIAWFEQDADAAFLVLD